MVTDLDGYITQNVVYIPYGEVFVEERNGSWASPYLFNAKELDEETGLYYYGARWLSVDPMWEDHGGVSPFTYCHNNPISRIDIDGNDDFG
jgi:RHS repeat-associated protein